MDTTHDTHHHIRLSPEEYAKQFNTDEYLCMYAFFDMVPTIHFIIENLVRIFNENRGRLGHDRALEFGGGPSLLASFILAQQVKSIRFSDYVPHNLSAVDDWIKRAPNAHDWSELFDRIIEEYQKQVNKNPNKISNIFFFFVLSPVMSQQHDQVGKNDYERQSNMVVYRNAMSMLSIVQY